MDVFHLVWIIPVSMIAGMSLLIGAALAITSSRESRKEEKKPPWKR